MHDSVKKAFFEFSLERSCRDSLAIHQEILSEYLFWSMASNRQRTTFDYEAAKDEIAGLGIPWISRQYIYSYRDSGANFDLFNEFYQKSQYRLNLDEQEFGIVPSRFFFNTEYSVNAFAVKKNEYYLISVNMGLVHKLSIFFQKAQKIFSETEELRHYANFSFYGDLHATMQNMAFDFVFYHEKAHLLQVKEDMSAMLWEKMSVSPKIPYSEKKHVGELDADAYAVFRMLGV